MRLRHSTEIFGSQATVYVAGEFDESHIFQLNRLCSELPQRITTLRLDLHALSTLSASTVKAIRTVLQSWRQSRNGSFRLALAGEHVVAVYSEMKVPTPNNTLRDAIPHIIEAVSPAQSAMYL